MDQPKPMSPPEQRARALLGTLFLILLFAGQLFVASGSDSLNAGLLISAAAIVLLVWTRVSRPPTWITASVNRLSLSYTHLLIIVAVCSVIAAIALDIHFEQLDRRNYLPVVILWVGGSLAWLAAWAPGWKPDWRTWLKAHRGELITIGLVTLAAAAFRFYQLGQIPRVINGDEGLIGQFALGSDRNPLANPFSLFENFGGLYMQLIALGIRLFGRDPFALRLMPAIGGSLTIPVVYGLGRWLLGRRPALVAAMLLAVSHAAIHFSRTVAVAYTQGTWLVPLELYFFISGLQRRSARRMALGGLFLGLHFSIYVSAQIIAAMLVVYLVIVAIINRSLVRPAWRPIAIFGLTALLVASPQLVYNTRHLDQFMARLNADGTFQSGWLASQMAVTGQSAPQILLDRIAHTFLSLIYYPADEFYGSTIPILGVVTAVFFMLGLGYSLWRTRDPHYLLLNGYFWSGIVAIGIFSVPPGADSYRVLIVLPAAILMAAIGLELVLNVLALTAPDRRPIRIGVLACFVGAIALINLQSYFVDFATQCRYGGGLGTSFASYLGHYERTLKPETTVYLLSSDSLRYGTHLSVDFLGGGIPVINYPDPVTTLRPEADTVIVAIPDRVNELRDWTRDHPGGSLHYEYDCGQLMLAAYKP